ncbi:MAG: GGDEF domain-containing protein, partial [Chitinophagaceae bacterium]
MNIKHERYKARLVGFLLIVTILAVILQSQLRNVLTIDSNTSYHYVIIDDHMDGGETKSHLEVVDNKLVLHCEIVQSKYEWPYCEIQFDFSKNGKGLDFSTYEYARIAIKYDTPQDVGIRIQARNFNPVYSKEGNANTYKYNSVEYYGKKTTYPLTVPLQNFQVPTWWLFTNAIPIEHIGPEFTNIRYLEVATGSGIKPGKYTLVIERLEFVGKYISDKNLYLSLLAMWGLIAFWYLLNRIRFIRLQLQTSGHRQQELEALNRLLNVRHRNLEEKLSRDPLTGVLNRDGIARLFEGEKNTRSQQHSLSIIFMDIDHFKKINDTYGHNFGDQILIDFAHTISDNTREMDLLARWGGEEFILACPNTNLAHAVQLA